jgi:L-ascorbate metabolism protein UlaG (beta-lactamase superfamily)
MTRASSDHFNGKTFFNPGEPPERGFLDVIRWRMTSTAKPWPESPAGKAEPWPVPAAPAGDGVTATWVGHATFVLRSRDVTILTDPMFSARASPVAWAGPRRAVPPGVSFDALPPVDVVLLSHDHYDHCDLPTLSKLARRFDPLVVAPLGHGSLLRGAGLRKVVELDWWGRHAAPGLEITLVPSRHWCRRTPFSTNRRLWGGFVLGTGGRQVYFVGDSGYSKELFREVGRRHGPPDLALIPIGAYEPRWFMAAAHMNPAEAVAVHRDVGARRSIGMHWGTFQLTDEGYDDPPRALEAALAPGEAFMTLPLGGSLTV